MKTIRKVTDDGIFQVTEVDERFYAVPEMDPETNLPFYEYYPSSSWICGYYPKGKGFEEYLKKAGDDAEEKLLAAGSRGSIVHHAIEKIIAGEKLQMDTRVFDGVAEREMTIEEWIAVKSFVDWNNEVKPKYLLSEKTVISKKYKYGGTIDCLCEIGGETWLLDFKTSKAVYRSHILQLSSYKRALVEGPDSIPETTKLAVLQLGYAKNKKKFKLTEVEDQFPLFLTTYEIWKAENPSSKPRQINLPVSLSIDNPLKKENENSPIQGVEVPGGGGHEGGGEHGRSSEPDGSAEARPRRGGHHGGEDN